MRCALIAVIFSIVVAGCGGGVAGEAHFEDVTTRELPIRVRITHVVGDWATIAVFAEVVAPGAEWVTLDAALPRSGVGASSGPVRRTSDGIVQLERGADWFRPGLCEDAVCLFDLVLRLDAPPAAPWRASIFVTVEGDTEGPATIEIVPIS